MKMRSRDFALAVLIGGCAVGAQADSLFAKEAGERGTLISETTQRFEVGDLITVMVRENTTATTRSDTDTKKESDIESVADPGQSPFLTGTLGIGDDLAIGVDDAPPRQCVLRVGQHGTGCRQVRRERSEFIYQTVRRFEFPK